ncbi:polymorphic toxin type 44 domain-containing protein [Leifsonia sp. P73]|uniref:polymorphic toxin type 44 domain-containing protein n=1 Tax=Leifsonia sp. P73 TaxID=3423959 RepID=UPI003DA381D7
MRNNVTTANAIIDRLASGSRHLIAQLDAGVLQGAAYTAGRGLFSDLILPGIAKLSEAVDDIQAEFASYEHAHSVVAELGDLDHDDLTQGLRDAREQLRLIEEQLEQNSSFLTQLQAVFTGDVANLVYQDQVLKKLRVQVKNEIDQYRDKIEKLEWFVADVSNYFSDSLQVMQLATQAAIELNKIAVEADGSYYTSGVNLTLIRGLFETKISNQGHSSLGIRAGEIVFDSLKSASGLSYDKLVEWLASDESQRLHSLARWNPGLFESMLREAMKLKADGDFSGAFGAFFALLSENGLIAFQGGQTFLEKFPTGEEWDMKRYLAEEYDLTLQSGYFYLHDDQGRVVRSDVFGNLNYGAMLAHWGVELETALKGANLDDEDIGASVGVTHDDLDDRAVAFGYELYGKYPNGLTKDEYYEEIANAKLFDEE